MRSEHTLAFLVSIFGAVDMKIVFPLVSRLTGKKILFPRVHTRNISPPGRDLFWRAVKWENFERSQYSKCRCTTKYFSGQGRFREIRALG